MEFRDQEGESEWEDVVKGSRVKKLARHKRKKNDSDSLGGTESEGREVEVNDLRTEMFNVVVRFEGEGGVKKTDPLKLTKIIKAQIGEVKYAKVLGDGNLLIGCSSGKQIEKAKKMSSVGKVKVAKVVRVGGEKAESCKGIMAGVPLMVNIKEIVENLRMRNGSVKSAKRMTRGIDKKETESVLIEFDCKDLPKEVYFGYIKYNIREFITKPMRCYNCQEFGHVARGCKKQRRCARCGGDHDYGKCGEGVKPKCCNCGGNHSVAFWGCEVMKQEVKVQQIKVKENISYADAVKRSEGEKQDKDVNDVVDDKRKNGGANKEWRKIWEEKKKLVTFIAGVINATSEIKSKTERIQIIVKAAVHHLELVGLKWEEVRDELNVQSSQDLTCVG